MQSTHRHTHTHTTNKYDAEFDIRRRIHKLAIARVTYYLIQLQQNDGAATRYTKLCNFRYSHFPLAFIHCFAGNSIFFFCYLLLSFINDRHDLGNGKKWGIFVCVCNSDHFIGLYRVLFPMPYHFIGRFKRYLVLCWPLKNASCIKESTLIIHRSELHTNRNPAEIHYTYLKLKTVKHLGVVNTLHFLNEFTVQSIHPLALHVDTVDVDTSDEWLQPYTEQLIRFTIIMITFLLSLEVDYYRVVRCRKCWMQNNEHFLFVCLEMHAMLS